MSAKRLVTLATTVVTVAVVSGCSGGGGSDEDGAPAAQQPEPVSLDVEVCSLGAGKITAFLEGLGTVSVEPTAHPTGDPDETDESDDTATAPPVTSGPGDEVFGPSCVWKGPEGTQVVVRVSSYDDWISAEDMGYGNVEPLNGLGDEAWVYTGVGGGVSWRRGEHSVHMELAGPEEQLVDLAWAVEADLWAA